MSLRTSIFSSRLPDTRNDGYFMTALAARRRSKEPSLDLTQSNPTRVGLSYAEAEIQEALTQRELFRYSPRALGNPDAREVVAAHYRQRGVPARAEQVVLTASTSEAYSLLFKLLLDPRDCVLVPRPSYPLFDMLATLEGVTPRNYQLAYDGAWHLDVPSVVEQVKKGAKAVVAVSPNNPTGSYLTRAEYQSLAALGVPIIIDEVFAEYCHVGESPPAALTLCEPAPLAFSLGGLSKLSALPQLKLGWIVVTGKETLVRESLWRLEAIADTYLSVSAGVQLGLGQLLDASKDVREQLLRRCRSNRAEAERLCEDSPVSALVTHGGWTQVFRLPETFEREDATGDEAWATELLVEHGAHPPRLALRLRTGRLPRDESDRRAPGIPRGGSATGRLRAAQCVGSAGSPMPGANDQATHEQQQRQESGATRAGARGATTATARFLLHRWGFVTLVVQIHQLRVLGVHIVVRSVARLRGAVF